MSAEGSGGERKLAYGERERRCCGIRQQEGAADEEEAASQQQESWDSVFGSYSASLHLTQSYCFDDDVGEIHFQREAGLRCNIFKSLFPLTIEGSQPLGRVQRVGGCAGGLHRQETAKASGK